MAIYGQPAQRAQSQALAGIFYGLAQQGPNSDQVLRAPRLCEELQRVVQSVQLEGDDFRQLKVSWVISNLEEARKDPEKCSLVAAAIFLGTAQACLKGNYTCESSCKMVDCRHLVRPISCLHRPGRMPMQSRLKASGQKQQIICQNGCDPLDMALHLSYSECRRVALLRCTGMEHPQSQCRLYHNIHEDQLFFRTTYFEAFERLEEDIQAVPDESIKEGGIIYSSGVGILRGSLRDGAPWVEQPPQVDVIWFGLPLHPHHGEQEIYSQEEEMNLVSSTLDRVFAWACAHGADAVVMPPFACDIGGLLHPRLHFAGLVHEVSKLHERHLPVVGIASEHPAHCKASWWDDFAQAAINGRPVPPPLVHVPRIPLMADKLVGKDTSALLEKRRAQQGVWSVPGSRRLRASFV